MKKPWRVAILDAVAVPAWWMTQQLLGLLDALARISPHSMAAGFNDEVDAQRLRAIRAVLKRGQPMLPATAGKFLLKYIPEEE